MNFNVDVHQITTDNHQAFLNVIKNVDGYGVGVHTAAHDTFETVCVLVKHGSNISFFSFLDEDKKEKYLKEYLPGAEVLWEK